MYDTNKISIGNIMAGRKFEPKTSKRPINYNWEEAKEFCHYCGIGEKPQTIVHLLKLFKIYGKPQVLGLRSWLKDNRFDKGKVFGLMVWKIKQKQIAKMIQSQAKLPY